MINVILYQPEIPQNTGNIMRTCAATGALLHIIGPMGFKLDDENLKRAGMDYLLGLPYEYYENLDEFNRKLKNINIYYVSRYGSKPHSKFDFSDVSEDIYIMFGKESSGIPKKLLLDNFERCLRLPMKPFARSLNLSNCVAIVIYEILRQQDYYDLSTYETIKGEDYLEDVVNKDK